MVSFPKYESYKDSDIDWIGEIPSHWEVLPFKALFKMSIEKNGNNIVGEMLSVSGYRGIEIKTYGHEEQKRSSKELVDYRVVKPGQLVVNTMWLNYAGLGVSDLEGYVSPAYRSYWITEKLHGRFTHYLLRSHSYVQGYTGQMQGIRPNSLQIKNCDFNKFPILVPKLDEQKRIAEFLDRKTAEIDQAIEQKQRLIKLLKEQKAILIDRAVTKGLNSNVPMRDSGVDWIGEIPKHWSIAKIKHIAKFVSGGTPKKDKPEFWGGDIPWVSAKEMKQRYIDDTEDKITQKALQKTTLKLLEIDTIIVVVRGMILARKIPVALAHTPVTINQDMKALIVERETCIPEYLLLLLEGINHHLPILLEEAGHGTKTLPTEGLSNFELPIPPRSEQLEIIALSQKKGIEIDSFIKIANQQILLLGNLKQIIISEAVTGKMKI